MDRTLNRRLFLKLGGMSLALGVADTTVARRLIREREVPGDLLRRQGPKDQRSTPLFVTVFLRGGADGLNIVPPTGSERATYDAYRPGIGVPMADIDSAGTRLVDGMGVDSGWALNPRMTALMPSWEEGALAVFPDVHYDDASRSHFDSQQFYENGTPWQKFTPDGWANRHLQTTSGAPLLRAIAFDGITPFAMRGPEPTLTFAGLNDLSVTGNVDRNERFLVTQELAYPTKLDGPQVYDPEVGRAGTDLIAAVRQITALDLPATSPEAAAIYATTDTGGVNGRHGYFSDRLRDLASLVKSNAFEIEIAEIDLYGWDTHNLQLTATNNHPDLCEALARGLAGFRADLGAFMDNVVVTVMTEFGRTAKENGSSGTDHGSASTAFVLGDPSKVQGRRVLHGPGGFAGLAEDDLRQRRDLVHSTDYRAILSEIVRLHLGNESPDVFPGYTPDPVGVII